MKKYVYSLLLNWLFLPPVLANQPESAILHIPDTTVVEQLADTTAQTADNRKLSVLARKATVPVLLIGLGVTHMDDEGLFEGSRGLRRVVQRGYTNYSTTVDNYLYHTPLVLTVGLNLARVKGEHHYAEQALLLGMTHFVNRVITNNLKTITAINRPDGSSDDAFPSAHTSKAFAYATFFHKEYGSRSIWYSIAGYSVATATGTLRILNDRHWLSDVLAGAGIGILSAEVVYLVYPRLQEIVAHSFHKKQQNQLIFMPYYSGGAGGIALVWQLR
ncbi:phosphatase PAP2 family protein [Pontibacter virosus]|uniref:PAP2 superfamily protein n=1 Tax=Pontibacter virosus TaxID=1765052 RepID=A0A2U1B0T2_9BACT|nr:phosphatase PAP2 family protein [Pontibacter virosus]PVY42294.1 PAP2 superfamily protein [Pontibacter virosus]